MRKKYQLFGKGFLTATAIRLIISIFFSIFCGTTIAAESSKPEGDATKIYKKVSPSVVLVKTSLQDKLLQGSGVIFRSGKNNKTGLAISWIVTNAHVINGARSVEINVEGSKFAASVEYENFNLDLALLSAEGFSVAPIKVIGSKDLVIGQRVFAIGSPLGLVNSISDGIVSGMRLHKGVQVVQTTAPISSGNSGGGLFDSEGQLVGITTFKIEKGENLNFAVSSDYVIALMDAYSATKTILILMDSFVARSEWKSRPSDLTDWLMTTRSSDGKLMYQYFNDKIDYASTLDEKRSFDVIRQAMNHLLERYEEVPPQSVNSIPVESNQGSSKASGTTKLNCTMFRADTGVFQFDLPVSISIETSKVNNKPAIITPDEIVFPLGSDNKYFVRIDRFSGNAYSGDKAEPNLLRGKCSIVGDRKF